MSIAHLPMHFKQDSILLNTVHLTKRQLWFFCVYLALIGCDATSPTTIPLLTECTPSLISNEINIGIGKDGFEAIESIEHALIVGGYQGGHHLWGALRFQDDEVLERVGRLHMIVCDDEQIIAQALYGSIDTLLRTESDVYGIPIVFVSGVDVASLDGRTLRVLVGLETGSTPIFSQGTADLKCCGHVADGD